MATNPNTITSPAAAPSAPASSPSPAPSAAPAAPSPAGPSGSPEGRPPAGPSGSRADDLGYSKEIAAVFSFDPFGPADEPAPGPGAEGAEGATPPVDPAAAEAAAAAAAASGAAIAPAQAPTTAPNPELEALKASLQQQALELAELRGRASAQPAAPAADPANPDGLPAYNYTVPDQLITMLASENPVERKQGISAVMTAVSTSVHRTFREEVARVIPVLISNAIQQDRQQEAVRQDFYSTYPALNRPELRPLIQTITQQFIQETRPQNYSPAVRDALAQKISNTLGIPLAAAAAAVQQQPRPAPAQAPQMLSPNARPGGPVGGLQSELDDFMRG